MFSPSPSRRSILSGGLVLCGVVVGSGAMAQTRRNITVYKTPWCGCCGLWVGHLRQAGWTARVIDVEDLAPVRARHGVPDRLASCHTGVVGRYAIEGHVPAADIDRLIREAPAGRALVVPGMPAALVDKISKDVATALSDREIKARLMSIGAEVIGSTPKELDQFRRAEIAQWTALGKQAGISLD